MTIATVRLRHLAEVNPPTPEFDRLDEERLVTFLPLEAIWPGALDTSRIRPKAEVGTGYTRFRTGDILIPKITPTFQANRMVIASGLVDGVGAGTTELHVVRPRPGVDPRYLYYTLASRPFLQEGEGSMFGVAGQKRVPDAFVRDFPVRLPTLRDQGAIADYLDAATARIDAAVATRRTQSALLNEAYDSVRTQSILRGLDPVTGTGELPLTWERPLLGVLLELHRGMDLPSDARKEGPVPVVSSGGVSGRHSVAACSAPGVVTGRYGTVGDVYYIEEPFWPLNTTLYVSDFRGNDPRWVFHLLSAMPLDIDAEKSAVTGINRNVVGQLRAVRPPVGEQREIAAELDRQGSRAETVRAALKRQINLLRERRQAVITAAVTGELEIPGVAA